MGGGSLKSTTITSTWPKLRKLILGSEIGYKVTNQIESRPTFDITGTVAAIVLQAGKSAGYIVGQ